MTAKGNILVRKSTNILNEEMKPRGMILEGCSCYLLFEHPNHVGRCQTVRKVGWTVPTLAVIKSILKLEESKCFKC